MKIFWTGQALLRLKSIRYYIKDRSSNTLAKNLIKKIVARAEVLAQFPEMSRIVPEINSPNIREFIEENYRVVYRLSHTKIEILTVFEGHKLLEKEEIGKAIPH